MAEACWIPSSGCSSIDAAELQYLFENRGREDLWLRLKKEMKRHTNFSYYPFNGEVLDFIEETKAKGIHDKIIVSTARLLRAEAVVTKDEELVRLDETKVLW